MDNEEKVLGDYILTQDSSTNENIEEFKRFYEEIKKGKFNYITF